MPDLNQHQQWFGALLAQLAQSNVPVGALGSVPGGASSTNQVNLGGKSGLESDNINSGDGQSGHQNYGLNLNSEGVVILK